MEKVNFISDDKLYIKAEEAFIKHKAFLQNLLPEADINISAVQQSRGV
ncbi:MULTISPECIES: hypothetical protein [Allobacillus]|nr:hypothetical protein [Allobacillus salarius]